MSGGDGVWEGARGGGRRGVGGMKGEKEHSEKKSTSMYVSFVAVGRKRNRE